LGVEVAARAELVAGGGVVDGYAVEPLGQSLGTELDAHARVEPGEPGRATRAGPADGPEARASGPCRAERPGRVRVVRPVHRRGRTRRLLVGGTGGEGKEEGEGEGARHVEAAWDGGVRYGGAAGGFWPSDRGRRSRLAAARGKPETSDNEVMPA